MKAYIKVKNYKFEKYKFLKAYIKMEKVIKFGDIELYKQRFHQRKEPISIEIVVSNKVSFGKKGFKYFIGYKNVKKLDLCVYFSQKWVHIEKTLMKLNMSFLMKDNELLEKYNEIWEKAKDSLKREFDSKPVYNKKYLKAKIKSYFGKINTKQ